MNVSLPLGRKRMPLKPQAQICCGAKLRSATACAVALIHREGDEDSSTDIGRKVETRAGRSWREGHEQRNARWLGERMVLFQPKEGHG